MRKQLYQGLWAFTHAVGKGSVNGPRLIIITYNGGKSNDAPIALSR